MSAISLWNDLSCRIRRCPKTAGAFGDGCAPIFPSPSPASLQAPWRQAPQQLTPQGAARPAYAQPGLLPFTLASQHLDAVCLAQLMWQRMLGGCNRRSSLLPLSPSPGVGPSVELQKSFLSTAHPKAQSSGWHEMPSVVPRILTAPCTPPPSSSTPSSGGGDSKVKEGGREEWGEGERG